MWRRIIDDKFWLHSFRCMRDNASVFYVNLYYFEDISLSN